MYLICMSKHVASSSRMSDSVFKLRAGSVDGRLHGCVGAARAGCQTIGPHLAPSWFAHVVARTQLVAIFFVRQWLGRRCVARLRARTPA